MHSRIILAGLISAGFTTSLDAAPPTDQDWWATLGQYAGTFDITTDTGLPGGQYSLEWEEPFSVARFAFHTSGGDTNSSSGVCFWNPSSERCEFAMVQEGPEGRLYYDGHITDASPGVVTWACRGWNDSGVVRTFTAVDSMSADGNIARVVKDLTGEPLPATSYDWTRVNPFLDHFPGVGDYVGEWTSNPNGEKRLTSIEWGAGRRSIRISEFRFDDDGGRVLTATCDIMYDVENDRLVGRYLDEYGVDVSGLPTVVSDGSIHTISTDWSGSAKGAHVAAMTSAVIDGTAGTVTNVMTDFRLDGAGFPAGPMKTMVSAPVVMTRQK